MIIPEPSKDTPRLALLGAPMLFSERQQSVRLPSKAFLLLSLLILEFRGNARRSVLSAWLWEGASEEKAFRNLRQLLLRIRRVEQEHNFKLLTVDDATITYDASCVSSDLSELLALSPINDAASLQEFLNLRSGDFLHGLPVLSAELQSWVESNRQHVNDLYLNHIISGTRTLAGAATTRALRYLVHEFPHSDRACRALMKNLHENNCSQEARFVYLKFRRDLQIAYESDPDPKTTALFDNLLRGSLHIETGSVKGFQDSDVRTAEPESEQLDTRLEQRPHVILLRPEPLPSASRQVDVSVIDGLIEDVTLDLCRLKSFAVIAPYSAFQISDQKSQDWVGNYQIDYSVRFFLHPGAPRITLQFIENSSRQVLWSEEFSLHLDRMSENLRTLAKEIAGLIADQVDLAELKALKRTGVNSAYRYYLMGREQLRVLNLPNLRRARKFFRSAVDVAPDFTPALSAMARTLVLEWVLLARDDQQLLFDAQDVASRAVEADPFDGSGYRELGRASLFLGRMEEAIHFGQKGERYAPHHADVLADLADTFVHGSDMESARQRINAAIRLNPLPPDEYLWTAGGIEFFLGNYQGALSELHRMRNSEPAYRLMSACAAMAGDLDQAKRYRDETLAVHPDFRIADWISRMPQRDTTHLEHYVTALRTAGFQ